MRASWWLLGLLGCATAPVDGDPLPERAVVRSLGDVVADAAALHGVPADLLLAVGAAETGLQPVQGHEEHPGRPTACGILALRDDVRAEAAALAGVTPEATCTDTAAHVQAVAALWASWADDLDLSPDDGVDAWAPVVARYAEATEPEAVAAYVHDAVYRRLAAGVAAEDVAVKARAVAPDWPLPTRRALDHAGAIWRPSPNFNSRSSRVPQFVVIHTCEGIYSGCWSWLANAQSGVSAHYVVNEDGSEVSQLVDESDRAWHISATYDCDRNDQVLCTLNGTSSNTVSVGIEHGGYASQTSFDPDMIQRSAELVCDITDRWGIPLDANHVVGHGQLQPWNRTDPGANWPWATYLASARTACGEGPSDTPVDGTIVIDSNDADNAPGTSFVASPAWTASTNVGGYWNTGYLWTATEPVSDPARFRFALEQPACFDVEAWWTAGTDRTNRATFVGLDDDGSEVGRALVDQRGLGSQWNRLGTWFFSGGDHEVYLSKWAPEGAVVIADAVRLVPSDDCAACDEDDDGDGVGLCDDACPDDGDKSAPGTCGCGTPDDDLDGDGTPDCIDGCPADPSSATPGPCGCLAPDTDGDTVPDCLDVCPDVADPDQADTDGDGVGDACAGTTSQPAGGCTQVPAGASGLLALAALAWRRRRAA